MWSAVGRAVAGEHVVDVGCGTGHAALLAAGRGATVTGVDPRRACSTSPAEAAVRGLDVASRRVRPPSSRSRTAEADVVLSVFGVIFASDPRAAAAEMARVSAPGGRIVLSAWLPSGATHRAVSAAAEAVRTALGAPAAPPPFAWHERGALATLFAPHGFEVTARAEESMAFTASSPRAYLEEQGEHPLAKAGQAVLEPARRGRGPARADARDLRGGQRGSGRVPGDLPVRGRDRQAPSRLRTWTRSS